MKAIYKITNKINGKCYIGQTNNPRKRWIRHKSMARAGCNESLAVNDAMRECGVDNFSFEVIGWYENYNEMEKYYIEKYNSIQPTGYNIMRGGDEPPHLYGEEHPKSVYSQESVDKTINDLLSHKYTQKEIAEKNGVSIQLVTSINRGVTHRRPGVGYPIIKTSTYNCSDAEFEDIVYLLKNSTCTCAEIGLYFGFSGSTIKAINSGRNLFKEGIHYPIRNFRGKANSQSVEAILAKRSTDTIDTCPEM